MKEKKTKYAVVDVETTGGNATYNRIIEIAIVITDGVTILDTYEQLINPERAIPPFIQNLTGIRPENLDGAPVFQDVAEDILELLKGCIFVAHNVHFDYTFVKRELENTGLKYNSIRFCSVRASRKIIKGQASYSLGKLCKSLDIPLENRHRALGDAHATALLLHMLLESDESGVIDKLCKRNSGELTLPPNISKNEVRSLPDTIGNYFFKDAKGQIIYVGKANNIRNRVMSHFTEQSESNRKTSLIANINSIDYEETGSELVALIKECLAIKKHWPRFNRSWKKRAVVYGIYSYYDQKGYERLAIAKAQKGVTPILVQPSLHACRNLMHRLQEEFSLCPQLIGLQEHGQQRCYAFQDEEVCFGACIEEESPEDYNKRLSKALEKIEEMQPTYLIEEKVNEERSAAVLVESGAFSAMGYLDTSIGYTGLEEIKNSLELMKDHVDVKKIIYAYQRNNSAKLRIIHFEGEIESESQQAFSEL